MTPKERAQRILFAGKTHGELWDTIEQAIIAATDAANARITELEAQLAEAEQTRLLMHVELATLRVCRIELKAAEAQLAEANAHIANQEEWARQTIHTIAELEARLAEANARAEANYHRMPRRGELGAAIQRAEAAEARAEAAEKKARDLALVIETAPTYAEPRIAAQVVNQLTERAEQAEAQIKELEAQLAEANARIRELDSLIGGARYAQQMNFERTEQAEAREGRLREAIESVFQEKRGGVYFSFSAKNGLSYSYRLDEDRAEAVRGILRVLKAATRPDYDHPSSDEGARSGCGAPDAESERKE